MNVEPIPNESLRFYVESESELGMKHLVDLSLNRGHGSCSCQAFSFICEPNLKAGKTRFSRGDPVVNQRGKISHPDQTACKHLEAVYRLLLEKLLSQASARAAGRPSSVRLSHSPQTKPIPAPDSAEQW